MFTQLPAGARVRASFLQIYCEKVGDAIAWRSVA
jgi:hypothetical protein